MPEGDEKRFADPTWSENPAFFAVRQGYLAASHRSGKRSPDGHRRAGQA